MKKYIFCTIFLLFVLDKITACFCIPYRNLKEEVQNSQLIIKATVTSIDTIKVIPEVYITSKIMDTTNSYYGYFFMLRVSVIIKTIYKGKHSAKEAIIITGGVSGNDCGYRFKKNKQYIIFCIKEDWYTFKSSDLNTDVIKQSYLSTSDCSRTTDDVRNQEKQLKQLLLPKKHSSLRTTRVYAKPGLQNKG